MSVIDPQYYCSAISWNWSLWVHKESSVHSTGGKYWGSPHGLRVCPFLIMTEISIVTILIFHRKTVRIEMDNFIVHSIFFSETAYSFYWPARHGFPLVESSVQSGRCWWPPRYGYHYCHYCNGGDRFKESSRTVALAGECSWFAPASHVPW